MKARQILEFVLTNRVGVEKCVTFSAESSQCFSTYLGELADDSDCEDADYFAFWSSDEDWKFDRIALLKYSSTNYIDFELPTKDGWWAVVKIED